VGQGVVSARFQQSTRLMDRKPHFDRVMFDLSAPGGRKLAGAKFIRNQPTKDFLNADKRHERRQVAANLIR